MTDSIQADNTPLRCRHCGGNRISVPARSTDETMVTCTDCGDEIVPRAFLLVLLVVGILLWRIFVEWLNRA